MRLRLIQNRLPMCQFGWPTEAANNSFKADGSAAA